jgi:hypothetical protein
MDFLQNINTLGGKSNHNKKGNYSKFTFFLYFFEESKLVMH